MVPITNQDYIAAAGQLGCDVSAIKAVAAVESSGAGFLATGEVRILFEPHIFWRQLQAKRIDPKLVLIRQPEMAAVLYEHWGKIPYGKSSDQWDRLRLAGRVNLAAAYNSASFGKFQVMGFNAGRSGFMDAFDMERQFQIGEANHLKGFVAFLKSTGLQLFLAAHDWTHFARNYNGAGFRNSPATIIDDYDYKLAQAYQKLKAHV